MKLFISLYILLVSNFIYSQSDSNSIKIWNQFSLLDDSLKYTLFVGGPSSVCFNLNFDSSKIQLVENGSFFIKEQADLPFIFNKSPLLDAQYIIGDQLEQNLAIYHSQPLSNRSNYSVSFMKRSHDGYYLNQATNANFFQANYFSNSNNDNYTLKVSLKHHRVYNEQNGGIVNDSTFTDSEFDFLNRNFLPVNMNYAFSNDKLWRIKVQQHIFKMDSNLKTNKIKLTTSFDRRFRNYYDSLNASLFLYNYFDSIKSNDSLVQQSVNQEILYFLINHQDSTSSKSTAIFYNANGAIYTNYTIDTSFTNHDVGFKHFYNTPHSNFKVLARFTPFGFRKNNFDLHFDYSRSLFKQVIFKSTLNAKRITPNYVFNQFNSNHMIWNNSVNDVYYFSFKSSLGFGNFRIKSNQFWIKNPIYFNPDLSRISSLDTVQILQNGVQYQIHKKKFDFNIELIHQYQGGLSIYQLPKWLAYSSYYYKFLHSKSNSKLFVGFRARSFSVFNLMEYSPQINQFLVSNKREQESYIIADFIAKAEIKNVTIFTMLSHINAGLLGFRYFTSLHYPQPDRYFKFGLKWLFLD